MPHNPNEDTEFNDALRAHGILPPKPPTPPSPSSFLPSASELRHHVLSQASASALGELQDEALSSDEERLLASYRAKKVAEMKKDEKKKRKAGVDVGGDGISIKDIGKDDFVKEVSEASKMNVEVDDDEDEDEDEGDVLGLKEDHDEHGESKKSKGKGKQGMGVVCFLYKDSIPFSNHLYNLLLKLSPHCPFTKFVKIRADQCIENYPDRNVPTLLLYKGGDCVGSITPSMGTMKMGLRMTVQDLERILLQHQILSQPSSSLASALRTSARQAAGDASSEEDEDDEEFGTIRRGKRGERGLRSGGLGLGVGKNDDEDSDYDL